MGEHRPDVDAIVARSPALHDATKAEFASWGQESRIRHGCETSIRLSQLVSAFQPVKTWAAMLFSLIAAW